MEELIIEKKLGIPADYQFKALKSKNYLQANWHQNKWCVVEELLKPTKEMKVLDLGTGSGNFEMLYSQKLKEIVGTDYNENALDYLKTSLEKQNIQNVRLIKQDIRNIDINEKFDAVILVDVLEHIKMKDAKKLVYKLKDLLNQNGLVIIITPNYKSLWLVIEWLLDKVTLVPKLAGEQHLAKFTNNNLKEIFKDGGFKTADMKTFNLFSYIFPHRKISTKMALIELKTIGSLGNMLVGVFRN